MNYTEWLTKLIAFDTTSSHSNLELIHVIQDYFDHYGLQIRLTKDPHEAKANLFATLPSLDGNIHGGIILSGHTDVVPVAGQEWFSDPFTLTEKHERYYGRGTCDMKGFIAVALGLVPKLHDERPGKPVHFAFSYDEETGCRGAPMLVDDITKAQIRPDACIVGEPSNMQVVTAHKGIQVYRCCFHGIAAHSSLTPQGCNAIDYAAQLVCFIRQLADEIREKGVRDAAFDVPFTTMSTNMIKGGIAQNTIPEFCEFIFEFRNLPSVKPDEIFQKIKTYAADNILPRMQKENNGAFLDIENIAQVPAFECQLDAAIVQLAMAITNDKTIHKVAYATEAGIFQAANIPTIVCGPGSIEQAHRANEYVEIAQLKKCEIFLEKILRSN